MKKIHSFSQTFIVNIVLVLLPVLVNAQKITPHDTAYFVSYTNNLMARIYMSQKYSSFKIQPQGNQNDLEYRSNSKINVGVGATYNNMTLNVSYGLSGNKDKGKTKGIDFQFHLAPYRWMIDVLASFHKGNYLHPKGYASLKPNSYYYRPDVKIDLIGLAAYSLANAHKFSYRAALVQNEWQTKSAGSLLYGGNIYYGSVKGDSTLIPAITGNAFLQKGINTISFVSVGPGIGYAYTLVIEKYFFITGSLIGNFDINFCSEKRTGNNGKKTSASPSAIYKGAIGYNSNTWSLSGNITGNMSWIEGASTAKDYVYDIGNFRIMLAKKIGL